MVLDNLLLKKARCPLDAPFWIHQKPQRIAAPLSKVWKKLTWSSPFHCGCKNKLLEKESSKSSLFSGFPADICTEVLPAFNSYLKLFWWRPNFSTGRKTLLCLISNLMFSGAIDLLNLVETTHWNWQKRCHVNESTNLQSGFDWAVIALSAFLSALISPRSFLGMLRFEAEFCVFQCHECFLFQNL